MRLLFCVIYLYVVGSNTLRDLKYFLKNPQSRVINPSHCNIPCAPIKKSGTDECTAQTCSRHPGNAINTNLDKTAILKTLWQDQQHNILYSYLIQYNLSLLVVVKF